MKQLGKTIGAKLKETGDLGGGLFFLVDTSSTHMGYQ